MLKRSFDLIVSTVGLLALSPLLIPAAILIRLDSPGPVFFTQMRIGRDFRPFRMYKLRTMFADKQRRGPSLTVDGDPRITRIGGWLRRTKLDEMPQLLNVWRGEMSLVGPRPEMPAYVELFRDQYQQVLRVRPGMTDPASLRFRDEATLLAGAADPELIYRQRILPEKLRLSADYAGRSTFWSDLRLIIRTVLGRRDTQTVERS